MSGRDIGSYVLPNADIKVFLTASIEERASRRWHELCGNGYDMKLAVLTEDIARRDRMDSEREASPLVQTEDAVLIDTTGLSIEAVVEQILTLCEAKDHDL